MVGLMHDNRITKSQLADELGVTREYVSMVLNGHKTPTNAEERFTAAVKRIIIKSKENQPGLNRAGREIISDRLR